MRFKLSFCTDFLLALHAAELRALLGAFSCSTDFRSAITTVDCACHDEAAARCAAALLSRYGRMELLL